VSFDEFHGISIFSLGCDFYNDYEFHGISIFSLGCDFYNIFYSMHGYSTTGNLP